MTQKEKKNRMAQIAARLKEIYPEALCALEWGGEPWKLLIMGRLSAQCTDARVNLVCRELFAAYPTPQALAEASVEEIENYIRSCGLYHVKAQNTKDACTMLVRDYGGQLPDTMEELLKFPGVGRKVANLLLGDVFGKGGVVTDTHCIRICGRLGMYPESLKDPLKVERILDRLLPPDECSDFCHRIVQFGRDTCSARAPKCNECPLAELCEHARKGEKKPMNESKKVCRILLIGNSYTYYNELWDRLSELAALTGIDAQVDHVTKGGAILAQMLDPNEVCGAEALQKLTTERYNTVVLQDNSMRTVLDREGFEVDIKRLHELIEANGARTLLYQTWARRAGSEKLTQHNLTPESMTKIIARAYREVGASIGARVAHVGEAFYNVVCNHPEIDLYDPDGSHPSPAGTALAALCIFLAIFDRIPERLPHAFGTDSEEQAAVLLRAAIEAMEK